MQKINSFRDPSGFCVSIGQKLLRPVTLEGLRNLEAFANTSVASEYFKRRQLAQTRRVSVAEFASYEPVLQRRFDGSPPAAVFEHERIEFLNYPFEWAPEMLLEAGRLTLELARQSLDEGFGLKDATPFNILFRGSTAVFVDLLSFEQRDSRDPLWRAYAQFMRTFLLPLLVNQRWGVPLADIFLSRRDGLEPEEVYRMCHWLECLRLPYLTCATLPTWLGRRAGTRTSAHTKRIKDPERARFIVRSLYRRLERLLDSLGKARESNSRWTAYMATHSYSRGAFMAKEQFVRDFLQEYRPKKVLDVGANTGCFSFAAAEAGASVVAIDADPGCVGRIWREAAEKRAEVLPLVVDLGRPSPSVGWRNRECLDFLARACGAFDAVFMLAVLHHLMIQERVPLAEILDLVATFTTEWLLVEFVGLGDPMFKEIARGREHLFNGLDSACFETASQKQFHVMRRQELPEMDRCLYLLRKRGVPPAGSANFRQLA